MFGLLKRAKNLLEDNLNKYFNTIDMEYEFYVDIMENMEEILKYDDETLEILIKHL